MFDVELLVQVETEKIGSVWIENAFGPLYASDRAYDYESGFPKKLPAPTRWQPNYFADARAFHGDCEELLLSCNHLLAPIAGSEQLGYFYSQHRSPIAANGSL